MSTAAEKILALARAELGEREFPPNSNKVKYNTEYYGQAVSGGGYAWCAVFIWWLFRRAGAPELYYGGRKTAYCPTLMGYHKGQAVTDYKPGDVIFFNFNGKKTAGHVGICESWDGTCITTIDGNTGTENDANGGAVMRRRRHKKYIAGAYRPAYEEGIDMDKTELRTMIREVVKEVLDEENPVYKDLKDVPAYWRRQAAALLDAEVVNGGTPKEVNATDLNIRMETLKAAIIAANYHEAKMTSG